MLLERVEKIVGFFLGGLDLHIVLQFEDFGFEDLRLDLSLSFFLLVEIAKQKSILKQALW